LSKIVASANVRVVAGETARRAPGVQGILRFTGCCIRSNDFRRTEERDCPMSTCAAPARAKWLLLLDELQDDAHVRETSVAWGELRASAVFHEELRATLRTATRGVELRRRNPAAPGESRPRRGGR
jgi:hypothetical protein